MAGSTLTGFNYIPENSEATPGLWNSVFSVLSQNIAEANNASNLSSNISTLGMVTINANSNVTNYLYFNDTSNQRSDYIIGSQVGGTADGLNIWDVSGNTMLASFSKQSVRFFVPVTGAIFDVGGANTITYNAGAFVAGSALSQIQAAISAASIAGLPVRFVYVPGTLMPYDPTKIVFDPAILMEHEGQLSSRPMRNTVFANGDNTNFGQLNIYSQLAAYQADTFIMASASSNTNITADYDVVIGSEYTNGRVATGVLQMGTDLVVSVWSNIPGGRPHGMYIQQANNAAVMEFPVSGGIVEMMGTLRGQNSGSSNLVFRIGGPSGGVIIQNSAATGNIFALSENGLLALLNRIRSIDGTLGNPMYAFTADPNTGIYRSAVSGVGISGNLGLSSGSVTTPSFAISSESSLGFYQSGTSHIGLSYGGFSHPDGTALLPSMTFSSESSLGWYRSGASHVGLGYGGLSYPDGTVLVPSMTFSSESSLGFFRSGTSHVGLSYGGFVVPDGVAILPGLAFSSESSLGWYRSGVSTIASSYGTVLTQGKLKVASGQNLSFGDSANADGFKISVSPSSNVAILNQANTNHVDVVISNTTRLRINSGGTVEVSTSLWADSGISVGIGGTLIPAISSMSSLVGAFIVQGSASSFTGIAWAAAKIGDHIITSPFQGGAASSLSSGLVAHSIVTVNGQIEFRLSNVSTLVQNQSSQSWIFTRISAF